MNYSEPMMVAEKPVSAAAKRPFRHLTEAQLLQYGVPAEWIAEVQQADEDAFVSLAVELPAEASEALLNVAVGIPVERSEPAASGPADRTRTDPFLHPDSQRRFRLVASAAELQTALDYPWEQWAVFLHPTQRALIDRGWNGPVRVSGSAGTGKTVVAVHRAV
ncbi:MAG: DNA helicase, partial [Planctomycetaceae bacterium]